MREVPLSNCEREFILSNIAQQRRLDGRGAFEYRDIKIAYGVSYGCCHVQLGKTRVLAQVSCEVGQPKQTRPHDGILFVNVELSPMASPSFEQGRPTEGGVELSRLMERCLKESRCLDLESLCIVAGEKAWHVRVDIHILNHEGNILDCASIAAVSALAHFKRPDVTVKGEEITIHTMEEKNPVPLSIHHIPLLVSFTFFSQGKYMLIDPSEKEERVMEGKMVVGMNKHRELCTLQVTGEMLLLKDQVLRCSNIAVVKVTKITELIHEALENDQQARLKGEKHGFAVLVSKEKISAHKRPALEIKFKSEDVKEEETESSSGKQEETESSSGKQELGEEEAMDEKSNDKPVVDILTKGVGMIGEGGGNAWVQVPKGSETAKTGKQAVKRKKKTKHLEDDGDSSEEDGQLILH